MHLECREYRRELIEAARAGGDVTAGAARDHVNTCEACARFLEDQLALTAMLRSAAAEAPAPGALVEARVLSQYDRTRVPAWRWVVAASVAAGTCFAALWLAKREPAPVQPPAVAEQRVDSRPFLTIPYTIPLAPEESAVVWRGKIPVSALIAAGFRVQVSDPSAVVEADVLVSQDGRARAIRPLSISITQ